MVTEFLGIIPARYGSTRFPGKPLAKLGTRPMIQWVYESAAYLLNHLLVATDDSRISDAVKAFGGNVVMTSPDHTSGTERCAEAFRIYRDQKGLDFSHVVNIQGDEPLIKPEQLKELTDCFQEEDVRIATLICPLADRTELENPNVVKVAVDNAFNALYFSRSPIPYVRDQSRENWFHETPFFAHIGLYAYSSDTLNTIVGLPPSSLELAESLEQLRWMQHGIPIRTRITKYTSPGVDTPEDLKRIQSMI